MTKWAYKIAGIKGELGVVVHRSVIQETDEGALRAQGMLGLCSEETLSAGDGQMVQR